MYFLFFFAFDLSAQTVSISKGKVIAPDLLFKRFNSADGLPDDRIRTIFQDSKGFLWLGTMNGVARYDGYSFKKFYKNKNANSISGNWTNSIREDKNDNIWIGTREGLNKYNPNTDTFENFRSNDRGSTTSIPSNIINTLQFDVDNKLWIGTPKGLSVYDTQSKKFTNFNSYPLNRFVCKIIKSDEQSMWIATVEGVVRMDLKTYNYQFYKINVKPNAYGDKFWSMLQVGKDLFLGTASEGLIKLAFDTENQNYGTFEYINKFNGGSLIGSQIFDIAKSSDGSIWLGTSNYGIAKIDNIASENRKITFYKNNSLNNKSISNNGVFKVFIDRSDVLWCGTEEGLNKLDLNLLPFKYYTFTDKKSKDFVRSVYANQANSIWFGTSKTGLYNYNTQTGLSTNYSFANPFLNENRSILVDGENVWNGALGGASKVKIANGSYANKIGEHAVFAFLKDTKGNVWIGTNNGLYQETKEGEIINYFSKESDGDRAISKFVRSLFEASNGDIWIGFENGSVSIFHPYNKTFTNLESAKNGNKLQGSIILSIAEYPKNVIWVGSENGLNKVSFLVDGTYNIKSYFESDGLPDKSINGIIADEKGNLWLSTIKGLVKFNVSKQYFQTYLADINFSFSGYYKLNNNNFLFACSDGFLMFDPNQIKTNNIVPNVLISDFKLFNKSIEIKQKYNGDIILDKSIFSTKEITLDYYNNQFSIEFAALHFSNPSGNSYAYRMLGFDDKWIYVNSSNRSATYTNLDNGTYTFEVKASNYSGVWNNKPQTIKITILPPPWKSWWAIILYIIVLNSLLYVFVKYILVQSQQKQQIVFEKKEKEQLKNLNQMKLKFFTDISHEFRTPLSLILGPVEDFLIAENLDPLLKKKANLIQRNTQKLLYLLDELMTFQKMDQGMLQLKKENADIISFVRSVYDNFYTFAQKRKVQFDFEYTNESCFMNFDLGKMEMVLNNLLFNAFKFAKVDGNVKILVQNYSKTEIAQDFILPIETENWICISIEDNGKGISNEEFDHIFERFFSKNSIKGTGVGLSLTKSLVELHQGTIIAQSIPQQKTTFKVYLPVLSAGTWEKDEQFSFISEYNVESLQEVTTINQDLNKEINTEKSLILIVDDNVEVLDYLEMIFKESYTIAIAENGVEALNFILKNAPDLIISDVMMPEMDGVELCEKVKSDINVNHIPFILLTAKSTVEDRIKGLYTGADDYIPKPFYPNILKIRVQKLLDTQKQLAEKFQAGGGVLVPKNILKSPLDEKFLNKVISCIKANISNDELSVEELGSMVAMSRSNLFRKLKAITGQTPIEFIYFIRLKYAMDLLLERKMNMSEIAYEVGFKNPSSFTKSFKKQFGKSPSEYLNTILENQKAINK